MSASYSNLMVLQPTPRTPTASTREKSAQRESLGSEAERAPRREKGVISRTCCTESKVAHRKAGGWKKGRKNRHGKGNVDYTRVRADEKGQSEGRRRVATSSVREGGAGTVRGKKKERQEG